MGGHGSPASRPWAVVGVATSWYGSPCESSSRREAAVIDGAMLPTKELF